MSLPNCQMLCAISFAEWGTPCSWIFIRIKVNLRRPSAQCQILYSEIYGATFRIWFFRSSLVWVYTVCPDLSVWSLFRIITVLAFKTKPIKWHVRPAKTRISLGICPGWSESSLGAQWVAKDPSFLHADSEDSDQTGRIWVFAGRTYHFVGFAVRRLISEAKICQQVEIVQGRFILPDSNS